MGMRHSVEGRVPLLDPTLVRWSFAVPQEVKVGRRFQQKLLFRQAVRDVLPPYILDRPKQGFSPPVAAWAEELLAGRVDYDASPLVDAGLLRRGFGRELQTRGGESFATWTLGTLVEWSNRAVGSAAPALAG
jgi:asparagine synthase (glutamine-hydrolysing)